MKKKRVLGLLCAAAVFCCMAAPAPLLAESVDSASESGAAVIAADSHFAISGTALTKYSGSASFVTVPDGVRVIRGGAFAGNKTVVTVYLPDSVEEIEGGAFENCANLQNVITSGMSRLSTIGANAFAGCPLLNISFAVDVGSVSGSAFYQKPADPTARPAQPTAKPTAGPAAQTTGKASASTPVPDSGAEASDDFRIILQPVSVRAAAGDFVSFTVLAVGGENIRYQWMRRVRGGEQWTNIEPGSSAFQNADTATLSFTVTSARSNQEFRCAVMDGKRVLTSDVVSVEERNVSDAGQEDQAFGAPAAIGAWQQNDTSAVIIWSPVEMASGYELYRSANGGEFELVKTMPGYSYTDTGLDLPNNHYSYAVAAVRMGDGSLSEWSDVAEVERLPSAQEGIVLNGVGYTITPEGAVVTAYQGNASSLVIPASVQKGNLTYTVVGIGPNVFRNNKTLKTISLPNTIRTIEAGAFAYCNAMIDR